MSAAADHALGEGDPPDWTGPLTPSGNLGRRLVISRAFEGVAIIAAMIAVAMLSVVVIGVFVHGLPVLSPSFVFKNPVGEAAGGIFNALAGTVLIVLVGTVIAVPVGVLTGLFLTELAGPRSRLGRLLKLVLDLMQGLPTIVVALFIYGLIVIPEHKDSGLAASLALAIIMLPLIARSSQEVLLLVPNTLREAADALGVARWRAVVTVILPSALGGIVTGVILATARAAGETAPMLVLNSLYNFNTTQLNIAHGVPNIPMYIETVSDTGNPQGYALCWGAATVLLVTILLANILARVSLARSRAKMGI